jgi:hypothetical protein
VWRGMNVSFRDMLFLLVFMYLLIGGIALAHVHKKAEESKGAQPPGNVIVELRWAPEIDADVDLWVQGPGDVPVGYSNKGGAIFNLVRDDLGHSGDPNSMNYEVAYGRGRWPGEYVVNAHLYRSTDGKFPIPITATASVQGADGQVHEIVRSATELSFQGQEVTVFRFRLDEQSEMAAGSLNRIHKDLRAAASGGVK